MSLDKETKGKLNQALDSKFIETREGAGGKLLNYLPGAYYIRKANEIFEEGNWAPRTLEVTTLGITPEGHTMYVVRVELVIDGCLPIVDVGFGTALGEKPEHHEMAIKGAATDGLKRCLRIFGDQFGLSLYEEKGGWQPVKFDETMDSGDVKFTGGKHEGKTIAEVYKTDPSYIQWVAENWRGEALQKAATAFLEAVGGGGAEPEGSEPAKIPPKLAPQLGKIMSEVNSQAGTWVYTKAEDVLADLKKLGFSGLSQITGDGFGKAVNALVGAKTEDEEDIPF